MISSVPIVRRAVAGLAVLLVASCGTTGGQPTTASTSEPTVGQSSPPATTRLDMPVFVERPREIRLDDLNPCDLWTEAQLRELGVHPKPRTGDPKPNGLGRLTCGYNNAPPTVDRPPVEIGYTAITYLDIDIEDIYNPEPYERMAVIEVGGFPAIQEAEQRGVIAPCSIYIGTAQGQYLNISLSTLWPNERAPEESCEMNKAAAEMAMMTLRQLR